MKLSNLKQVAEASGKALSRKRQGNAGSRPPVLRVETHRGLGEKKQAALIESGLEPLGGATGTTGTVYTSWLR